MLAGEGRPASSQAGCTHAWAAGRPASMVHPAAWATSLPRPPMHDRLGGRPPWCTLPHGQPASLAHSCIGGWAAGLDCASRRMGNQPPLPTHA
eukprot:352476-Chlamydomonas_euryale.AAC.33